MMFAYYFVLQNFESTTGESLSTIDCYTVTVGFFWMLLTVSPCLTIIYLGLRNRIAIMD